MVPSVLRIRRSELWRSTIVGAAAVYVAMRLVSAAVILLAQRDQPAFRHLSSTPYLGMITHWDGIWFRSIAVAGYPTQLPAGLGGTIRQNAWAFYPGFPMLVRAAMQVTDATFALAASVINLGAGVVAACAIALLLETRIPRAAAVAVVGVWAALPMAPALQLAYSEALAMALLSLALLWLVREQWTRATVASLLLGLTRPILPPLAVVYAVAVWLRWRRREDDPLSRRDTWVMGSGLALTVAGSAIWPVVAWWATGVPDAYSRTEAAWHHGNLTPFSGLVVILDSLVVHAHVMWSRITVIAAITVVVALTGVAVRWAPRLHPVLVTWCGAYLVFDLATGNMHADELRMLLPLFPLVAVICGVSSARLPSSWRLRAGVATALGIGGQYAWVMLFVRFLPGVAHAP